MVITAIAPLPVLRRLHPNRHGGLAHDLPVDGIMGPVAVVLGADGALLLDGAGVTVATVVLLVGGQRRRARRVARVPAVPAVAVARPVGAPMVTPARRRIHEPAVEVHRRLAVVAYRHAQHVHRHHLGRDPLPRAVVPGTGVPAVIHQHPVQAVIEKVVGVELRRVVHRIAGHLGEHRVGGRVDADLRTGHADVDVHTDLRLHGHCRCHRQRHRDAEGSEIRAHGLSFAKRLGPALVQRPAQTPR